MPEGLQAVRELFGRKSEATVKKRGASLLKFIRFLQEHHPAIKPFPFATKGTDLYVKHLKSEGAKGGAVNAFMEAVRFAVHVVGVSSDNDPRRLFSLWALGYLGLLQSKRPDRVQSTVLTVEQVCQLEHALNDPKLGVIDRYGAGAFLFCLYSRSRVSDVRQIHKCLVDVVQDGSQVRGFLECGTRHHKTARQSQAHGVSMPLVAPVNGVTSTSWGVQFVQLAKDAGLPFEGTRSGPLLPAPASHGGWLRRSVTSAEAGSWLRALLARGGHCTEGITGHSLKSTTLDWSGKFGLSDSHQTVLGHRSLKGSTMHVYMRDKLASPLREYERMLGAIRHGLFLPDATRSGMLANAESSDVPDTSENLGPAVSAGTCDSPSEMARKVISETFEDQEQKEPAGRKEESQSALEDTDSSESSSSSSESADESSLETDWVDKFGGGIASAIRRDRVTIPEVSHWRHKRTMTIHSMAKGAIGSVFTCGRKCTSDYAVITESAFLESRLCAVCKKSKPIRDVGALVALVDQKMSA